MRTNLVRRALRRPPTRWARARWLLVVAAMGILAQTTPSSAHSIYWRGDMGQTGSFCLIGVAEIQEGPNYDGWERYGFGITKVETKTADPGWAPCWQRPPAYVHEHAAAGFAYYWETRGPQGERWEPCFGSDWSIRNGGAFSERSWLVNSKSYGCGSTYYQFYGGIGARNGSADPWIADWRLAGHCCRWGAYYHWFAGEETFSVHHRIDRAV